MPSPIQLYVYALLGTAVLESSYGSVLNSLTAKTLNPIFDEGPAQILDLELYFVLSISIPEYNRQSAALVLKELLFPK